ncbi:hypothetical protein DPMN_160666 [Dreissena polymorpha]|uniref:Uncharacterized protein n=1 Tax=Dreissena polymorpha TaxID=45954 RepID=A0A9D4ERN8_DREPO|nr:hypothetical protein DPMN_160666 [Dreissena polymorpha]
MYVQERLTEALPGMKLIVPDDAGLAVLKGAVLVGHFPEKVTSRVMTHTYGIDIYRKFDPKTHGNKRKVKVKSEWMLDNCFQIFVRANDEISLDHKLSYAIMPLDSITTVPVYRSLYENPEYTTDPGCELLGTLKIRNSDKVSLSEQNVVVIFMFGQTELFIKVRHEPSGVEEILSLDCLQ